MLPDYDDPITTSSTTDITEYTELLMLEAGLDMTTWNVELFGGKRSLGRCQWRAGHPKDIWEGKIRISRPWFVTLGIEGMLEHAGDEFSSAVLEDVIRHEIAHALCIEEYGVDEGSGHGPLWKKFAREVHAEPTRCESRLPSRLMASYKRRCSNCHTRYKWLYQYSERKGIYTCTKCDAPARESVLEVVENEEQIV